MKITQYRYEKKKLISRTVNLLTVINSLRNETKSLSVTSARNNLLFTLPGRQNKYIERLPVNIFGAHLIKDKKPVEIRQYNGLVLLEVNHLLSTEEAIHIRTEAADMPQTLLAFIGTSGRSVKIVVPFSLPDGTLPTGAEQIQYFHVEAYQTAVKHYQPQLSRNITLKEPFPERGCRMSYDPDLWYNPEAVPIRIRQPLRMPRISEIRIIPEKPVDPLERIMPGIERSSYFAHLFAVALVEAIRASGKTAAKEIRPVMTRLAESCCSSGIPEEEALQYCFSYRDLASRQQEVRMIFRSVYMLQKMFGEKTCFPEAMSLVMQLEEFMQRRYIFRRNVMSGEIEFRDRSLLSFRFRPYSVEIRNMIATEAHKEGLKVWDKDIDRYVQSEHLAKYHPIEDYLFHLSEWDGTDHIRGYARRINCNYPEWPDYFYRWFLSMVAHWLELDQEYANSTSPLIVGSQGCGKSTFCRLILPPELRSFYTDSVDFSKKRETELSLHRYALINMDEFDSVKESQQGYLKNILQKPVVSTRLPNRSTNQSLRRYATFIATSNNFDLLTDHSGSRRYLCVEAIGMIEVTQPVDYEQLYSQAMIALENKERFWFTKEEEENIIRNNWRFKQMPIEEQFFFQYFRIPAPSEEGVYMSSAEILTRIKSYQRDLTISDRMVRNLGRILSGHGLSIKRSSKTSRYKVILVDPSS